MLRAWACLTVLLAALYVGTASPEYYAGDDRYYLNLAGQMVEAHTVALRSAGKPDPDAAFTGPDGRTYAKYTLGHPLMLATAYALVRPLRAWLPEAGYALAQRLAFALVPALMLSGALVLLAARARALGYPDRTCLTWALGMGLATNLWPASKTLLSEPTQAFVLTLIGVLSVRALEAPTLAGAVALSLVAAFALHLKITLALAIAVAGLALAWRPERRGARLAVFVLCMGASVAALSAYNVARSGKPWLPGYSEGQDLKLGFCMPLWSGLPSLLWSSGKGLFLYSPFLVLALAVARRFWRRHPTDALVALALTLPQLALYAKWWGWYGDWAWGARFLVPLHPLLGLFALPAVERTGRARLALVLAIGVSVQLLGVVLDPAAYIRVVNELPIASGPDKLVDTPPDWPYVVDGLLHNHWYPSFSPLKGHAWLVSRMLGGAQAGDHPWAWRANPRLAPPPVVPPVDLWWDQAPGLAALLALIAVLATVMLARTLSPRATPEDVATGAPLDLPPGAPAGLAVAAALAAVALVTLPAAFRDAGAAARVGLVANALAAGLTALWIGRASAHLGAPAARVAVAAFLTTLLWPRARELSPFVAVALASAALVEAGLARAAWRVPAVIAVGLISVAQAVLRGPGPPPFVDGLYALVLAPGKSLVVFAPLVLAAAPRLAAFDAAARFLVAVAAVALGVECLAGGWIHDAGWGPVGLAPALVALTAAAGPALSRWPARALAGAGLAATLAAVLVSPAEGPRVQGTVRGLFPPGHSQLDPGGRYRLSGMIFVPDLSPVPTQLWLARLAVTGDTRAPWTGLFWRGYEPQVEHPPRLDLAWTTR